MLSQDGIMRFINIQTCKLLFEIGSVEEGISSSVISPHGRYIASIMENGSLNIYSVQALTQEINKVCPPVTGPALCTSLFPLLFSDFFRTHLSFWTHPLALKSCISSSDFSPGSFSARAHLISVTVPSLPQEAFDPGGGVSIPLFLLAS